MKKTLLLATLICYTTIAALAQHDHSSHEKQNTGSNVNTNNKGSITEGNNQLSNLLSSYYNIKNALVTGDGNSAASNAEQFLRTANIIDFKLISEGNLHILSTQAGKISNTNDLKKQRDYFADLSTNMAAIAKSFKLTSQPVYVQYCPMKKASWLSSEKQIRNPYYGSSMLTCGEVKETL